ncbi:helix-turn-helix domain-containing protein [Bradyrhizobium sp. USDA 3364]
MRFSDLLERTEARELTQEAAAEVLGISVRTFQRWAERYEAEGDEGLVDRRMGRRSPRRAPEEELEADAGTVPGQVRGLHGEALPRAAAKAA